MSNKDLIHAFLGLWMNLSKRSHSQILYRKFDDDVISIELTLTCLNVIFSLLSNCHSQLMFLLNC